MVRMRNLAGLLAGLLAIVGCSGANQQLKPPQPPEEFRAPPDDPRYLQPVKYPGYLLNQERLQDGFNPDEAFRRNGFNRSNPGGF